MWILKTPHEITPSDIRENLARLQRSRECDRSSAPMATVYVQIVVAGRYRETRLIGGHLSLHTDELERAANIPRMIYKALKRA